MSSGKKRILLIDDDRTFITLMQGVLRKNNYDVLIASNGQDGIECVEKERPDLIILDVLMPGMTGYEFIQLLRKKNPEAKKLPIIVISSRKSMKDFFNMWELSFFIEKPFQPQELLSKIEYALASSSSSIAPVSQELPGKGKKALIVGYDANEMMQIETIVKEQGFRVFAVKKEIEGMVEALNIMPDIIIIQYHNVKGIINALKFKNELREKSITKETPVLIVSASDHERYCLSDFNKDMVVVYRNHPELERRLTRVLSEPLEKLLN